jgi:hypothetical protein
MTKPLDQHTIQALLAALHIGPLTAIEALRLVSPREAARLAGISEKTLRRNHPELIQQISRRRQGVRVGDALLLGVADSAGD